MSRRLFVGIPLPAATAEPLAAAAAEVPLAGARVLPAENLHVTVHFLGAVDDARVDDVVAALGPPCASSAPFSLVVERLAAVPPRRPRMLWAAMAPSDAYASLADAVGEACAPFGKPPDRRPPRPHVTLARIRLPVPFRGELPEVGGTVDADACTLFESRLSPRGARYEAVAVVPLGPRPGG